MKFFYLALTFLVLTSLGFAEKTDKSNHSKLILLTEGVVGGVVGPTVRQEIIFDQNASGKCQVWVKRLKKAPRNYTYYSAQYDSFQFEKLLSKLNELKQLPLEDPMSGEDIYQMDISLGVFSEKLKWMNQAPSGCIHMKSKVTPSSKQKGKFQALVQRVNTELKTLNLKETTKESFEKASQKTWDFTKNYRVKSK